MKCPNCDKEMRAVAAEGHYGARVKLDQCPDCGGLWFDGMEAYQVKPDTHEHLDAVDPEKFKAATLLKAENLICPKDGSALKAFSDPFFPKSIRIESCRRCGGFWFNRGEFAGFQREQERRREENEEKAKAAAESDGRFDRQIRSLLEAEAGSGPYAALGQLGKFLSTPVRGPGLEFDSKNEKDSASDVAGIIYMVIRLLLRIFLKV